MEYYEQLNEDLNSVLTTLYGGVNQPDYLFHYTSQSSLHSMLSKGELWLSSIRGLNDTQEVVFGIDIIRRLIETQPQDSKPILDIIDTYKTQGTVATYLEFQRPTYVMSFSTQEDSLADWVNYADDGHGVCVKFKRLEMLPHINHILKDKPHELLLPVFYFDEGLFSRVPENEPMITALRDFSSGCLELISQGDERTQPILKPLIFDALTVFSSLIKASFHRSENEWRLIVRLGGPGDSSNIDVICSGTLKTIYRIVFPDLRVSPSDPTTLNEMRKIVDSFRVGPRLTDDSVLHAIRILTYKRWGTFFNVARSSGKLK